ncbi:ABC transporter permease [Ferrimonas balearica]|uniref:ABC transporter permease n=1 Tax=Ferrimonas balearica TaxID=44012 RepID=UPI001C992FB0|nr:ABC transporter permease [Ferrimonas balearica]MBY5922485.1 ABC transporter permease [Ferrimonas balearica]MBY5995469.1 ABC transporter permease [Ferrimonas balearica]
MSRWMTLWWEEFRQLGRDSALLITFFAGLGIYLVLYPAPYLHEVTTEQAVVVWDQDQSVASRRLLRALSATPGATISARVTELPEARELVLSGQAAGMVWIPAGFERNLRRGQAGDIVVAANANYFLPYGTIAESVTAAATVLSGHVRVARQVFAGDGYAVQTSRLGGVDLNVVPASNPGLGYLSYVLPGLFVLILHQLMLICAALIGTGRWGRAGHWQQASAWGLYRVDLALLVPAFALAACWYLGPALAFYDVELMGSLWALWGLLLPFLLATASFGIFLASLVTRRDLLSQILVLSSMPLLFIAGFVWPVEALPMWLVGVWGLVPAEPMMQGMIRLNQLGAAPADLMPQLLTLWGQALAYGTLAVLGMKRRQALMNPST